jgi:hypothetical protein
MLYIVVVPLLAKFGAQATRTVRRVRPTCSMFSRLIRRYISSSGATSGYMLKSLCCNGL